MGLAASVCQPSTLRMLIWPDASRAQNSIAAVSAEGSTVWVLIRRLNSSWRRSIACVVRALLHWLGGRRVKVKSRSPASSRLSARARCLSRHLRMKALRRASNLLTRRRIDHVGVVGGDLVVQALGRVREEIAMLVNRAPLDRHSVPDGGNRLLEPRRAVDDEELGPSEAARDEIVKDGAPGLGALAAHALDRQQDLLAVRTHADDDEQRDRGRFAIEPDANHGAVENEPHDRFFNKRAGVPRVPVALHLAPHPAHRVLADRAAEQGTERATHSTGVGPSEIGAGDQRVGSPRATLIGTYRLALPLRRLTIRGIQSGARHRDLHPAEGSQQRPRPVAMAVTAGTDRAIAIAARSPRTAAVPGARQRQVELPLDHGMDELAYPIA